MAPFRSVVVLVAIATSNDTDAIVARWLYRDCRTLLAHAVSKDGKSPELPRSTGMSVQL